jgi:hypothetical protein
MPYGHAIGDNQESDARQQCQRRDTEDRRNHLQEHQKACDDHRGLPRADGAPDSQRRSEEDYALNRYGLRGRPKRGLVLACDLPARVTRARGKTAGAAPDDTRTCDLAEEVSNGTDRHKGNRQRDEHRRPGSFSPHSLTLSLDRL